MKRGRETKEGVQGLEESHANWYIWQNWCPKSFCGVLNSEMLAGRDVVIFPVSKSHISFSGEPQYDSQQIYKNTLGKFYLDVLGKIIHFLTGKEMSEMCCIYE